MSFKRGSSVAVVLVSPIVKDEGMCMQENISHMPTSQDNPVCTVVGMVGAVI